MYGCGVVRVLFGEIATLQLNQSCSRRNPSDFYDGARTRFAFTVSLRKLRNAASSDHFYLAKAREMPLQLLKTSLQLPTTCRLCAVRQAFGRHAITTQFAGLRATHKQVMSVSGDAAHARSACSCYCGDLLCCLSRQARLTQTCPCRPLMHAASERVLPSAGCSS